MTICQVCREEIREGVRGGVEGWFHDPALGVRHVGVPRTRDPLPPEEVDDGPAIPAPELTAHPVTPLDDIVPKGARDLIKAVTKAGGRAVATHSRGPRMHGTTGEVLEMSDYVMVKFERQGRRAVARWVRKTTGKGEQKWELDTSWLWDYRDDHQILPFTPGGHLTIRSWLLKFQGPLREEHQT